MKILALDLGEKWVGSALSDGLGITCKPHKTVGYVNFSEVIRFVTQLIIQEGVTRIVIGNPVTNSGTVSDQTKKNKQLAETLKNEVNKELPEILTWILWDERLSSKRAQQLQQGKFKTKEMKTQEHSIAAAFILQSYLDHQAFMASF